MINPTFFKLYSYDINLLCKIFLLCIKFPIFKHFFYNMDKGKGIGQFFLINFPTCLQSFVTEEIKIFTKVEFCIADR